jgi:high affinity cGMP-specific 3',5'-cyclic phosphodiesterase 9
MLSLSPTSEKRCLLVSPYIQIPENINSFDFDTLHIDECFVLKNISGHIFKMYLSSSSLHIKEEILSKFIEMVCENYNRNHFHNFQHAVNILQMTYKLLLESDMINKLKPVVVFATLIAAISHDIDHPGNTNSYEINSLSKYAMLYNDSSVLENHHCSLTFELLDRYGLLNEFKGSDLKEFRKTIITCILGTDMSKHGEFISKFEKFNFNTESFSIDEQYFIASLLMHCADLSNSIKDFNVSFEWSKRISLEFYEQTIKEEIEGLTSLSFMKVRDNLTMCLNEINFIKNVSIPMWILVSDKFDKLGFLLKKCQSTLEEWKKMEAYYISTNDINNLNY